MQGENASDQTPAGWCGKQSIFHLRSAVAGLRRTTLVCGGCGGVTGIDGRWVGTTLTQRGVFIERGVEGAKYRAKYPPNLQLAPLELTFVVFNV